MAAPVPLASILISANCFPYHVIFSVEEEGEPVLAGGPHNQRHHRGRRRHHHHGP